MVEYVFLIHSVNLCLSIRELNPFSFKVTTDKELTFAILLFSVSYSFFVPYLLQ